MSDRQSYDAALAAIRMAARAIEDQRARHEVEQARFGVFAALQSGDSADAQQWLRVLRIATRAIPEWASEDVTAALVELAHEAESCSTS